jgi:hypothetical protein
MVLKQTSCSFLQKIPFFTVKKVRGFPVSSRDVSYQTLSGREYLNFPGQWEFGLASDILAGDKITNLFYSASTALFKNCVNVQVPLCMCRASAP